MGVETAIVVGALLSTGVAVRGQRMQRKAQKRAEERTRNAAEAAELKRKESLVTREQGMAKSKAQATSAGGGTSSGGGSGSASSAVQTLGSSDLYKRTLG